MFAAGSGAKDRMIRAFFAVLEKKHYSKITVSELIEAAGVSRTTFYRHYTDIFDMYEKVCTLFIEKFIMTALVDSLKTNPKYDEKFFEKLCDTISCQQKYIFLLCGENGDRRFFERAFEIAEKSLRFLTFTMKPEEIFKLRFVIYAGVSCFVESIIKEEKFPIDVLEITKEILKI